MSVADDLERMAALLGLEISRSDLERLAPLLHALYADLDRLTALPIAGLEPHFTPRLQGPEPPQRSAR
jgi:hypothetical protein